MLLPYQITDNEMHFWKQALGRRESKDEMKEKGMVDKQNIR